MAYREEDAADKTADAGGGGELTVVEEYNQRESDGSITNVRVMSDGTYRTKTVSGPPKPQEGEGEQPSGVSAGVQVGSNGFGAGTKAGTNGASAGVQAGERPEGENQRNREGQSRGASAGAGVGTNGASAGFQVGNLPEGQSRRSNRPGDYLPPFLPNGNATYPYTPRGYYGEEGYPPGFEQNPKPNLWPQADYLPPFVPNGKDTYPYPQQNYNPQAPNGGAPRGGGGPQGDDLAAFLRDPANAAWWKQFQQEHQGMDPYTYYSQPNNAKNGMSPLQAALRDREWGDRFMRERGVGPTYYDWTQNYLSERIPGYRPQFGGGGGGGGGGGRGGQPYGAPPYGAPPPGGPLEPPPWWGESWGVPTWLKGLYPKHYETNTPSPNAAPPPAQPDPMIGNDSSLNFFGLPYQMPAPRPGLPPSWEPPFWEVEPPPMPRGNPLNQPARPLPDPYIP